MTRVLVAGVDTSTQSTKVRITDAATGEQVRFGQAKHPDWEPVECPTCGRKCWKHPEADRLAKEQGAKILCTECAIKAGLLSPFRKGGPNRAQRRRAKRERRK